MTRPDMSIKVERKLHDMRILDRIVGVRSTEQFVWHLLTPTLFYTFKVESTMITWNNLDTLTSFKELENVERVDLVKAMAGENGAERVKNYSVPMAEGLTYNYAAKQVDDKVLTALAK